MTEPALTVQQPALPGVVPPQMGHRVLPGEGNVPAILALPQHFAISDLHAALNDLNARGWHLDIEAYSRIRGPYHYFGLSRTGNVSA